MGAAVRMSQGMEQIASSATVCGSITTRRSAPAGYSVGDEAHADRFPRLSTTILPGVAEVGDNRGHPVGSCSSARIEQQQQRDQMLVERWPGWLDDVDVVAPHLGHHRPQLAVGELLHLADGRLDAEQVATAVARARFAVPGTTRVLTWLVLACVRASRGRR
jgi:hypothetical protein